jgi:hypothetical protein
MNAGEGCPPSHRRYSHEQITIRFPATNVSNGKGTAPTHIVYQVLDREGDKSAIWTRIGAAWPHNDGKG